MSSGCRVTWLVVSRTQFCTEIELGGRVHRVSGLKVKFSCRVRVRVRVSLAMAV
jgi:hypothetical protein